MIDRRINHPFKDFTLISKLRWPKEDTEMTVHTSSSDSDSSCVSHPREWRMIFAMTDSDPSFSHENNVMYANLRNSESDKKQPCSVDNDTYQTRIVSDIVLGHTHVRHTIQYTRHRLLIVLRVNCHLAAMTDLVILELLLWIIFYNTESFQNPIALFIPSLSNHPKQFQSQEGTSLFVSFLIAESLELILSVDASSRVYELRGQMQSTDSRYFIRIYCPGTTISLTTSLIQDVSISKRFPYFIRALWTFISHLSYVSFASLSELLRIRLNSESSWSTEVQI